MAKKKKQSVSFTVILAIIVVVVLGYLIFAESRARNAPVDAVVMVNGEPITQAELDAEFENLPPQYQPLFSKEDLLQQLIETKLLLQAADDRGVTVSEDEVNEQITTLQSQFPTPEAFDEALAQQGMTLETLKETGRRQLIIRALLDEVIEQDVEVSEEDIVSFYAENIDDYKAQDGEIRAAHILVETEEEAQSVLDRLDEEDFGSLAAELSIDPSAQVNKGDLGFFGQGMMVSEFQDAAFALEEGEVSAPVQTRFGYHVIQRLSSTLDLESARPSIEQALQSERRSASIDEFVQGLKDSAEIAYPGLPAKNTFVETGDELCTADGKPIVRIYTASDCASCRQVLPAVAAALTDHDVMVYQWELDTGDDLNTLVKETALSKKEGQALLKYNPQGAVPAYVFGCQYVRIGNAYPDITLHVEEAEFRTVLEAIA